MLISNIFTSAICKILRRFSESCIDLSLPPGISPTIYPHSSCALVGTTTYIHLTKWAKTIILTKFDYLSFSFPASVVYRRLLSCRSVVHRHEAISFQRRSLLSQDKPWTLVVFLIPTSRCSQAPSCRRTYTGELERISTRSQRTIHPRENGLIITIGSAEEDEA